MKLKKIVSLALAGILAVSMLTACGEGSSSSTVNPPVEETPVGYTATIYNELSNASKSVLTAGSGNVLKAAIESTASAVDVQAFVVASANVTGVGMIAGDSAAVVRNAAVILNRYVDLQGSWTVYGDVAAETFAARPVPAFADGEGNGTKVFLLIAPTSLTETQINAGVADWVDNMCEGLSKDTATHNNTYTLGVERGLIGSTNEGVYLIGIQVTKTDSAKA